MLRDGELEGAVAALNGDDRGERIQAALALATLADPRALAPLLERLKAELAAPQADWVAIKAIARVALMRRLRYSGLVTDLVALVEVGDWTHFNSEDPGRHAIHLLGMLGPAGIDALIAMLERSPSPAIRQKSARLLRRRGRAVPSLVAAVDNGAEDDRVRASAAASLVSLDAREAVPALIRFALDRNDRDRWGEGRIQAAAALGRIGDERAIEALVTLVRAVNEEWAPAQMLAWTALEALSSMHRPQTVPLLVDALETDAPLVRYYLARALGATRDERALGPLKRLLDDATPVPAPGGTVAAGARRGLRRLRRYLKRHAEGKM